MRQLMWSQRVLRHPNWALSPSLTPMPDVARRVRRLAGSLANSLAYTLAHLTHRAKSLVR